MFKCSVNTENIYIINIKINNVFRHNLYKHKYRLNK